MELNIIDRIQLLNILPKEGDFVTLIQIEDLEDKIKIRAEEASECKLNVNEEGFITYDREKEKMLKVKFTPEQITIVKDVLKDLNEKKKLWRSILGLYKKFYEI